ncbi:MAG: DUF3459 domain-containing protein [Actinobacteria bacterium]|nr:DUF3459 domain-containing protein [Actinomycetota bacterium]
MTPPGAAWWRGGAIYQVYPRSFADGNGDGIGDLPGAADRLEHVARLGADAVWLAPINPSGGVDGGYDVTDYLDVDPVYGGLPGFERFRDRAHELGLGVILDWVPNHTSDRHPWFVEARASRDSARRDWYVFADGRGDGPPNNWSSRFAGPAWVPDEATGQWYLASFYPQQPDLNWSNPEVRAAMADTLRVWVDRGVDGFRIDVVHRLAKDPLLRDNREAAADPPAGYGRNPGWYTTLHLRDENGPEVHGYLREMRAAVGPGTLLLGEVWILDLREVVRYLSPGELDLAFNFPFALSPWNPGPMAEVIELTEELFGAGWPAWHLSNHDMARAGTRFGPRTVRAAAVLLLTLRGTPVLYMGEEIGMLDGVVPPERALDPVGRDGSRTPMQWDASPNAGFAPPGAEPWLPVAAGYRDRNVAEQEGDPDSVLALYRRLLDARRRHPALSTGTFRMLEAPAGTLAYERAGPGERFVVALNFTEDRREVPLAAGTVEVASSVSLEGRELEGVVALPPHGAVVVRGGH